MTSYSIDHEEPKMAPSHHSLSLQEQRVSRSFERLTRPRGCVPDEVKFGGILWSCQSPLHVVFCLHCVHRGLVHHIAVIQIRVQHLPHHPRVQLYEMS